MSCGRQGHWYKQRDDKLKALKRGTKTCGLAEEEQGWVWVNKLKAKQVDKKELLSLANFHLWTLKFHMYIFIANVRCRWWGVTFWNYNEIRGCYEYGCACHEYICVCNEYHCVHTHTYMYTILMLSHSRLLFYWLLVAICGLVPQSWRSYQYIAASITGMSKRKAEYGRADRATCKRKNRKEIAKKAAQSRWESVPRQSASLTDVTNSPHKQGQGLLI